MVGLVLLLVEFESLLHLLVLLHPMSSKSYHGRPGPSSCRVRESAPSSCALASNVFKVLSWSAWSFFLSSSRVCSIFLCSCIQCLQSLIMVGLVLLLVEFESLLHLLVLLLKLLSIPLQLVLCLLCRTRLGHLRPLVLFLVALLLQLDLLLRVYMARIG